MKGVGMQMAEDPFYVICQQIMIQYAIDLSKIPRHLKKSCGVNLKIQSTLLNELYHLRY